MRKFSLLLLIVIFVMQQTFAQQNHGLFKRFGFKAGVNVSDMNFNKGVPAPPSPVPSAWKTGITFGFLLHVPLINNLSLQPEYLYSNVNGEDKSTGIKYSLHYLGLPVLLKYQLSQKFALEAGPEVDLLISAKNKTGGTSSNITHDTEERNFGIDAGLEYKLIKSLSLNARYMQGLNHIGIGQRSNVKEFKSQQFQLTASIDF